MTGNTPMPESGVIERTRDAMNAWLHMDLPADFDQLRKDLRHILNCIPETHQRTPDIQLPTTSEQITVPAPPDFRWRTTRYRYGEQDIWTFRCACGWTTGQQGHDPHDQLQDHRNTNYHKATSE